MISDHFNSTLTGAVPSQLDLNRDKLNLHQILMHDINVAIKEEEVLAAIVQLLVGKTPGPDGFTGCFYKHVGRRSDRT